MALLRAITTSRLAAVGLFVVALMLFVALFAPLITPFDPLVQDVMQRLLPPLTRSTHGLHVLGTDALGRDVLSRLMIASRVSIFVGVTAVVVSGLVGVVLGLISGY